jgi:putative transposase
VSVFEFVEAEKASFPIKLMCRTLGVSNAGFHAARVRPKASRTLSNEILGEMITTIHTQSWGTYGAPRVHAELRLGHGITCGRKRVARIMRRHGLQGVSRRRRHRTTIPDLGALRSPDHVERDFTAEGPDRLWVADITYVPTTTGFLFLSVVLDVFSRRIVGWSMADHLRTELVLDALDMAIEARRPDAGLIHHSDRGCQYTSFAFGRRCRDAGIVPSVGRVGSAYDNAMAESFFATLETELIDRCRFRNRSDARLHVFRFIEGFYNTKRRHSGLNYDSPIDYERRYQEAASAS